MSLLSFALLLLSGPAVLWLAAITMHRQEARRYTQIMHARLAPPNPHPNLQHVALFVPCKGVERGLAENLRMLFQQDLDCLELVFVVESSHDPAVAVIQRLQRENAHVSSRLVVAGEADDCGQKVHNLRRATEELPPHIRTLVFVDSDARPHATWVREMLDRFEWPVLVARTGYRWFIPTRPTLANVVVAAINNSIATLFGQGRHREFPVWGGAWTIRREDFESLAVRAAWRGTLSDDLVASRAIWATEGWLEFEPRCMTASMIDFTPRQAIEFLRRQYVVGRNYIHGRWLTALIVNTIAQVAFWGNAMAAIAAGIADNSVAHWHSAAALAMYGLYLLGGWISHGNFRHRFQEHSAALRPVNALLCWLGPVVGLANWLAMLTSIGGRTITWRRVRYLLSPGGRVLLLGRLPEPGRHAWDKKKSQRVRKAA